MRAEVSPVAHTRQFMTQRRATTVGALLDAGLEEVLDVGYDQLTIRAVAARAGVTHTTAYAYFTSKAHLVAEIYWRRLQDTPHPSVDLARPLTERVDEALSGPALVLGDQSALAQATLAALLTDDLEIVRLRNQIGADLAERVVAALGPDVDPELTDSLLLAFSGAMLQAGMGYFDFHGVVQRMHTLARLLTGD